MVNTPEEKFDWMADNGIFMPMINDTGRNIFYKEAIEAAVPGKVVVDIGCGTGFLSVLAAKAGAKKVYAVEQDAGRAEFARKVIEQVGVSDIVEVIHADFLDTDIPADIYVSETIGSWIFNENIIAIAEHARKHGGTFIPSKFEIRAELYENHPIFSICQNFSDAFEFQPDINLDATYETFINETFKKQHPDRLMQANQIHDLFAQLPKFNDLTLTKRYETASITVDLNQLVDTNNILLTIPGTELTPKYQDFFVAVFWKASYNDKIMDVRDTIWSNPCKVILQHVRQTPDTDVVFKFDPVTLDWKVGF